MAADNRGFRMSVTASTLKALLATAGVTEWLQSLAWGAAARSGPRLGQSRVGIGAEVFDAAEVHLLPELSNEMDGALAVHRGHYDLVLCEADETIERHLQNVNALGPGVASWRAVLCLETECSEAKDETASFAALRPGELLAVRSGTFFVEGVLRLGRKALLVFEILQFEAPTGPTCSEEPVRCRCSDGEVSLERRLLRRQPFFEKLVAFEGPRAELRLDGLCVADCRALLAFLAGDAAIEGADIDAAREVVAYLTGPEAALSSSEFAELCRTGCVRTNDRTAAERLCALATEAADNYVFFGLLHCWSASVEDAWNLCLDSCAKQRFSASLCLVSSGRVMLSTWPGPSWCEDEERGFIFLPDLNKDVRLYEVAGPSSFDSFARMDALLAEQVPQKTGRAESAPGARPWPPPVEVSVGAAARLARRFLRTATRSEFKKVLEAALEKKDPSKNPFTFTSTPLESRIYEFEWAVLRRDLL